MQSEECRLGPQTAPARWGFRAKESAGVAVAEFVSRLARARQCGTVLSSIHREIASVRSDFVELRSAKQRLEKMLADGLFAFTRKVAVVAVPSVIVGFRLPWPTPWSVTPMTSRSMPLAAAIVSAWRGLTITTSPRDAVH